MDNRDFGKQLEARTEKFSVATIRLTQQFPNNDEARILKKQLIRSTTSIGANYIEANRSKSESDFKYKIRLCEGEASEAQCWLNIVRKMDWVGDNGIQELQKEGSEILAIFTKINQSLRSKSKVT